ncbi:MAG: flagellar FliJ family protein [Nitrospirae bacterium]|nr:flagellar FliJ family protein [Nitrospirota bacterium]
MKLDAVRRYRAQVEEVVRMELLQARQNLQDVENLCQTLDAQMGMTADQYAEKVTAGMALEEFIEWQATFDSEASLLAQARQTEGRLRDAWHLKQNDLREAMQERRTIDRLAERMRLQDQIVQHQIEQTQMDEAARRTSPMGSLQNHR